MGDLAKEQAQPTDWNRVYNAISKSDDANSMNILYKLSSYCCWSCGFQDLLQRVTDGANDGSWDGFAFCSSQETEDAALGFGLTINFGAADDGDEPHRRVGQEILRRISTAGFEATLHETSIDIP